MPTRMLALALVSSLALALACTSSSPTASEAGKSSGASMPSTPAPVEAPAPTPTPTPTPEPAAEPLEPPSSAEMLPFYWVERVGQRLVLDAHDLGASERAALDGLEFDDVLELPRGDARIPVRFRHDRRFVLISEAGRVEAKVTKVELEISDEYVMRATLRPDAPLAAKHGMLAFMPDKAPSHAKVRLPSPLAASEPIVRTARDELERALELPKGTTGDLEVVGVALEGETPYVVALEIIDERGNEAPKTGLAIADAQGHILDWVAPFGHEPDLYEMLLVYDLAGDGHEALLYEARYHEGAFVHQLSGRPSDAGPFTRIEIAGSGL